MRYHKYLDKIDKALKDPGSKEELYEAFKWHKDLAKAYFDSTFPCYNARSRIAVKRYPYVHYEVIAYERPMVSEVDVFHSTTGISWYKVF